MRYAHSSRSRTRVFAALSAVWLAVSAAPGGTPPASAADASARLHYAKGTVQIKKSAAGAWVAAKRGQAVAPGAQIRTTNGSWAQIKTADGDRVQLSPRTTVSLKEATAKQTTFEVLLGRMRSVVRRLGNRRKYNVRTPLAVASVRGTEFDTIVDEDGKSTFEVYKGIVGVKDLEGLGSEVSVFKGQRTTIERGAPPTPPQSLNKETRRRFEQRQDQRSAKEMARLEARREITHQKFKEFLQKDVALEQRQAEYQDGKTLIDAFGMRVRVEEYIVRPQPNQFSFVTLNTRLNNLSFSRYDAFAQNPLPPKLNDINLLFNRSGQGPGIDDPDNWITKQLWTLSNGGDLYREWTEGGNMVFFSEADTWQVVFTDWYVEVKGANSNPKLLSHWKPTGAYAGGSGLGLSAGEISDLLQFGVLDDPHGYDDFDQDTNSVIGNVRPIDAVHAAGLVPDSNIFGNAAYQGSEGFDRTSVAILDGVAFNTLPSNAAKASALINAREVSALHTYDDPNASAADDPTFRVDQYNIDDLGNRLSSADRSRLGLNSDSINFESVATSSEFSNKIDLVLTPRIFKKAGLISE